MPGVVFLTSVTIEVPLFLAVQTGLRPLGILSQALRRRDSGALARSIELTLESPDRMLLRGDPEALHSIVGNLVDNALRYIPLGNRVQVEITVPGICRTLRVADDGPGVRAEERKRIFDRYYRIAASGMSGSGLGLAIVKQAVNRMHGSIRVTEGLHGKGCSFIVELPAAAFRSQ